MLGFFIRKQLFKEIYLDGCTTYNLGPIQKISMERGFLVMVNGRELALFSQENGDVFAIENTSSSGEKIYQGRIEDGYLIVPESGHRFSVVSGDGLNTHHYVTIFPSRVENDEVLVQYPTLVVRCRDIWSLLD